jgi:antitoxin HicB
MMNQLRFTYPVDLTTDEDGRTVARVPDVQGCVTDGATRMEALSEVADALEAALGAVMHCREDIPVPSPPAGRPTAAPGVVVAAKVALYMAMRDAASSNVALAQRLGCAETEVRRMLDPKHATKIGRLEEALAMFGRRVVITVEAA